MSIYNRIAFIGIIAVVVLMSVAGALGNIFGAAPGASAGSGATAPAAQAAPAAPVIDKASRAGYDLLVSKAKGLEAGSATATKVVYVVFDPKCPHCADLWNGSKALHDDVRFVWVPVAFLSRASLAEGAALIEGGAALMDEHEKQLLANERIELKKPANESMVVVATNTAVANQLGLEGVPFMWYLDAEGQVHTASGGLSAAELKTTLKL